MRLDDYLRTNKIKARLFAEEIDVSESYLSALRRDAKWPGREIFERISKATQGQVMPNDFININAGTVEDEKRV